jgi:signal transduction histidine kinase
MRRSVLSRLLLINITVVAAAMAVIALLLPQLIEGYIFAQKERELTAKGAELARLVENYSAGEIGEESFSELLLSLDRFLDARIWIVDEDGRVVRTSHGHGRSHHGKGPRLSPEQSSRLSRGETIVTRRYQDYFDQVMLSVGVPLRSGAGAPAGAIILHAPVVGIRETINSLLRYLLLSGLAALLLASLAAYFLSRRFSRPLQEMTRAARSMGRGDYSRRIPVDSEDELGQLARSLNALAGRLEETITALQRGKRKYESMVTGMLEGVVGVNGRGELTYFNDAAKRMLHLDEAARGSPLGEALPDAELTAPFLRTLAGGEPERATVGLGERVYSIQVSPVEDDDGGSPGVVGLIHDISEAERLEKMRREFVADVSHELRTPLTVLRGYSEALLDGTAGTNEKRRYLEVIRSEIERLNRLINDLLELSRLQARGLELYESRFNLRELAGELESGLRSRLGTRKIALEIGIAREIEVSGDRDRIMQVLLNLLENALRYSPEAGKVTLAARPVEDRRVEVSVRDEGPGIAEKELPHIWERFYRVDRSRDRKGGGTGLGLAIVKEIIEAHGESVAVSSAPGQGSTFSFTLPLA